jgi:outer membrane biosynthesis protein TonB
MKKVFVTFLVVLFATAVFAQTKTEIQPGDLPVCLKEWLKVNMKGYYFEKAFKVEKELVVNYIAKASLSKPEPNPTPAAAKAEPNSEVSKKPYQWLSSDQGCKEVKKIPDPKPEPGPKPKPQPAPKPTPAPAPKK